MLDSKKVVRLGDAVVEVSPSEVLSIAHFSSEKKRTDATFCPFDTCKDCGCNGDCNCDSHTTCSRDCSRDCDCDGGQCGMN